MEFATIVKFALPFLKEFGTELLAELVVCSLLPLFKKTTEKNILSDNNFLCSKAKNMLNL